MAIGASEAAAQSSAGEIHSDFNGDGYEDLAIGVPEENVGTVKNAGAVNVLYGSSSGLQTASPADQFWHQDSPGVEDVVEIGDRFGMALAAGDFNGDGYDDLAIGVPWENSATRNNPGAVNVLYGSAVGLQTASPADQFWHQDGPGVDDVGEFNDYLGVSVAASDFNGDGFDDLAIGVPLENIGSVIYAGAVNVLYGSSSGLQTTSPADQFWNQDSPGVNDSAEQSDTFGGTLVAGDFNNDGFGDLAIGGSLGGLGIGSGGESPGGSVTVLYGSSSGLQTTSPADQFWNQDSPGVNDTIESGDLGRSLGSGDFNGDGYDDLAIGVPGEDIGTASDAGAVNVLYGSSSGLRTNAAGDGTGRADQFWHQDSPGVEDAAESGDAFGYSLTTGDFNSDGHDDLAIGVVHENIGTVSDAGAVNVLYGSPVGLQTASPADQFWHQDGPGVDDAPEVGPFCCEDFGHSLTSSDFNGDGSSDLAITVLGEDIDNAVLAGAANVLYGSSVSGLQTSSPADQFWHQNSPGVDDAAENKQGEYFGWSLG